MKSKFIAGAAIILATLALTSWPTRAGSEKQPAPFSIVVTRTEKGLEMQCPKGCAWKTLAYSCEGKSPCNAIVDERGVSWPQ